MAKKKQPSSAELRDAILKRMGPMDDGAYPAGAAKLLGEYTAALRANWEAAEMWQLEDRFKSAVRAALGNQPSS
jgi:hypothetical protein